MDAVSIAVIVVEENERGGQYMIFFVSLALSNNLWGYCFAIRCYYKYNTPSLVACELSLTRKCDL